MQINTYHSTKKRELSYWQSFTITASLMFIGFVLQWFTGGIKIDFLRFPVNILLILIIIIFIIVAYLKFPNQRLVVWFSSTKAAISSIVGFSIMTLLMGFITQAPNPNKFISGLGLNNIAFSWQYSLLLLFLLLSLGFATIQRIYPFRKKNIWFILNHLGLWIAICSANFGFADQIHLRMKLSPDEYRNFAVDQSGSFYGLPFEIRQTDLIKSGTDSSNIQLNISISDNNKLSEKSISINQPQSVKGWNIYFFDMNKDHKTESKTAVVELIREPWQPYTYFGLILLMIGSFFVFWRGKN